MEASLSIVIVNYNSGNLLKKLIPSIINQGDEIIVIDNSSRDESFEIACSFKNVTVIRLPQNHGYAEGANLGIKFTNKKYIAILNPDTFFSPGYFQKLIEIMERDETIGAITGKILRFDRETIDTTGQFRRLSDTPRERGYGEKDRGQYRSGEVFSICGAAALFRRKALEEVKDEYGYFDSRYFMFFEDFDLGWRLKNSGWKAWYREDALGFHLRGGGKRRAKLPFLKMPGWLKAKIIRNYWLTILKNETPSGLFLRFPFILARSLLMVFLLFTTPSGFKHLKMELKEVI